MHTPPCLQICNCLAASRGCRAPLRDVLEGVVGGIPLPLVRRSYQEQEGAGRGRGPTSHPGSKVGRARTCVALQP